MARQVDKTKLVKGDPPNLERVRYDWQAIVKQLEADPMTWYKIFDNGHIAPVNSIRQGHTKAALPQHGIDVRTANNVVGPPRMCSLWLRYNPDNDERLK